MEDQRHYRKGENFTDPSVVEYVGERLRGLPGNFSFLLAWALFTAVCRAIFDSWEVAGLVGFFGACLRHLYIHVDRAMLEQRMREETTRAMIRELDAIISHRMDKSDERLDRIRDLLLKERERSTLL